MARAAAGVLADRDGTSRPVAVVGRDPRASGEMLEAAVVAGLASAGADVLRVGVVPTPALAFLTAASRRRPRRHDLGEPQPDARQRHQALQPRRAQAARRARGRDRAHRDRRARPTTTGPTGAGVGRVRDLPDGGRRATSRTCSAPSTAPLDGLTVVVDCAHGAAATIAPEVLPPGRRRRCIAIGAAPDGWNINDGIGSTHLGPLHRGRARDRRRRRHRPRRRRRPLPGRRRRRRTSSTATRSWPSARSRCTSAAQLARRHRRRHRDEQPRLPPRDARRRASRVHETAVGDRYVLEALRAGGSRLGGEQSGHVVFLDHATTGDGLLTGLALLSRGCAATGALARRAGRRRCTRLPQVLINVPVTDRLAVADDRRRAPRRSTPSRRELGDTGRVLLRPSRHRAARARDGRGAHRRSRPTRSPSAWPRSSRVGERPTLHAQRRASPTAARYPR